MIKRLLVLALVAAAAVAFVAWPRISDVETGRTPEYPDLKDRDYGASEEAVAKAAREALSSLPRWSYVGSASGPGGTRIQAVHTTRVFRFKDDVTITLRPAGGRTRVSVRSRSRMGKWDFGQNARNIRELLAELDRRLSSR